jgi:outer membrane protein W
MKHLVTLLALATLVAATAEAATTTAAKSTTTTKSTTSPSHTKSSTAMHSMSASTNESEPGGMELGLRAIGGSLGFVSPDNVDGTFTLGIFADCGRITPNIALEPRIDYWSKSQGAFGSEASIRDVSLGVRGKYLFESSNPKLQPFAGAGLSMHFLHSEVNISDPGFPAMSVSASDTKLGLDLGGGIATPIGPRSAFLGEAWYSIVSDFSQFSMKAGLSYRLH